MTPYRKKDQRTWTLTIATGRAEKPWARVTSGTRDKATADQMQAMLDLIGSRGKRMFWLRDAIVDHRLSVGAAYDAYLLNKLDELQHELEDVDLATCYAGWHAEMERRVVDRTLAAETVRKYRAQGALLRDGSGHVWRSAITTVALKAKLEAIGGSGTNRRRHAAAWSAFFDFCVEAGALSANPLRTMKLPKSNRTRERWIEWSTAMRLIHAMPAGAHRALAALRHGAGLEMQAALPMRRRDVDLENRVVWAAGRKNTHRDRSAIVLDDSCWQILADHVRSGFMPDAKLFAFTHRTHEREHHAARLLLRAENVEISDDYTPHASRSTFAVEMLKRGHDPEVIRGNMGLASQALLLKLYGKYRPRAEDLLRATTRAKGGRS